MLTAKENLRQTIIDGGKPDRFVNNYEGLRILMHPWMMHAAEGLVPGAKGVVDAWGVTQDYPEGAPGPFPVHKPDKIVVSDIDEWEQTVKAPPTTFPEAEWEEFQKQYDEVLKSDKAYATPLYITGLFELTHFLCSMDDALVYYLTDTQRMKDLLKYITEFELQIAEGICEHLHPNALLHHDDWGSETNSFLPPELFAECFVEPYKQIYGYYKDYGVEFIFHHNDSYSANLIPYMIEMGIDVWQGTMESNDVPSLLKQYQGQITFMGNIDNKDVDFAGWTSEDIERVAYEHLDGYDFPSYIPCITQGGPGSTFSGTYVELCKYIDQYNCEKFGYTQQQLEDARLDLQVIFG